MDLDTVILILKAVFSGKTGLVEAVVANPLFILVPFVPAFLTVGTFFFKEPTTPRVVAGIFFYLMAVACAWPFVWASFQQTVRHPLPPGQNAPPKGPVATSPTPTPGPNTPAKSDPPPVSPPQAPRFEVRADQTLITRKLRQPDLQRASREDCERACGTDTECGGYVFDTELQSCALHQNPGKPMPFKGTVIGIRR